MAEVQTTYTETIAKGYPGMVANGETSNRISRTVEDAAGIGFGKPAFRGVGDHGIAGTGVAGTFLGVTIAHSCLGYLAGQDVDEYPQYETAAIMVLGAIYVTVGGNVNDGDAISVGIGAAIADGFRSTAADATHLATGFVADETVTAGNICRIVRR